MTIRFIPAFVLVGLVLLPALAMAEDASGTRNTDVQKNPQHSEKENIYTPGLGEIMTATQMRHSKLWFAGKSSNWELAEYELFELQEGFDDAVKFHPSRSKLLFRITESSIKQLKAAIAIKNNRAFDKAFEALTSSCNSCHKATNFEFNRVIIPGANPFTNQSFTVHH